ncbi:hypothetical protein PCE1_000303 [Barthelona sp. PCE]
MGKVILSQRKGASTNYIAHTHKRKGAAKHRVADYAEKNGFVRGVVREIYHDSCRGAPLARVQFNNTHKFGKVNEIFICAEGMYTGQYIYCGKNAQLAIGNVLPIGSMPEGTVCCNVESKLGDRGTFARASGESCLIVSHNIDTAKTRIKLPSSKKTTVPSGCRAMVGMVAGAGRTDKPMLKAGRVHFKNLCKRWPVVRGVTRNPVEHPHGGGNHEHVGFSTCISGHKAPGRKVGLIRARRTGLRRGGKVSFD